MFGVKRVALPLTALLLLAGCCLGNVLGDDAERPAPLITPITTRSPRAVLEPSPTAKAGPTVRTNPAEPPGGEYFANCRELRRDYPAGVPRDHPAYRPDLDRDHDGRACENTR